jgi:hypothetical protein
MGLSALAAYPAYRLGGRESLQSMLLGAGWSLMTIVLSYLILAFAFRNAKQIQMVIVVGGFVVRVAMLFGLLALIARTLVVNLNQLVIWMVSFYMVLVVVEAWELAAEMRRSRLREG